MRIDIAFLVVGLIISLIGSSMPIKFPLGKILKATGGWGGITDDKISNFERDFQLSTRLSRVFIVAGTFLQVISAYLGGK